VNDDPPRNLIEGRPLDGWDIVSLLAGGLLPMLIAPDLSARSAGYVIGGAALAGFVRRRFLPHRPKSTPRPPSTLGRTIVGYVLMVIGGVVMLITGAIARVVVQHAEPLGIAITLAIFAMGAWVASLGFRRVA
jgi:hypothetical protein